MRGVIKAAIVAAVLGGIGLPATLQAQYTIKVERNDMPREAVDSVVQKAMHHDITHIRIAQDAFYGMHGRYAAALADLYHLHLESGATVTLAEVTDTSWQMTVTHPRLTGVYRATVKRTPDERRTARPAPEKPTR